MHRIRVYSQLDTDRTHQDWKTSLHNTAWAKNHSGEYFVRMPIETVLRLKMDAQHAMWLIAYDSICND